MVIELRNEEFYYENPALRVAFRWDYLDEYKMVDDILILKRKNHPVYFISKAEYSSQDFEKMHDFIQKKISMDSTAKPSNNSKSNPA
ncbi:MAG: hypothetical protein HRT57_13145 [Crocinitomicaceae bacterium]|nr:hypothetical protein [Crocinitomicaceae bacterium]